eukprot:11555396-Alexandrium_andersonii.AAC.1
MVLRDAVGLVPVSEAAMVLRDAPVWARRRCPPPPAPPPWEPGWRPLGPTVGAVLRSRGPREAVAFRASTYQYAP